MTTFLVSVLDWFTTDKKTETIKPHSIQVPALNELTPARTALFIIKDVAFKWLDNTAYHVNDETWQNKTHALLANYLAKLKEMGAIHSFTVLVNHINNTPSVINKGFKVINFTFTLPNSSSKQGVYVTIKRIENNVNIYNIEGL